MKNLFACLFPLLISNAIAQDSIQIVSYYQDTYKPVIKESYWLRSKDTSIRVGSYRSYFKTGRLWISGNYINGVKVGVWQFNDQSTWAPYLKYDFDTNTELYYKSTIKEKKGEYVVFLNDSVIPITKQPYCPYFLPYDSFKGLGQYIGREIIEQKLLKSLEHDELV